MHTIKVKQALPILIFAWATLFLWAGACASAPPEGQWLSGFGADENGVDGWLKVLAPYKGDVYAGGIITTAGSQPVSGIACWNGTHWSDVGGGLSDTNGYPGATTMIAYDGELIVGGYFDHAGGIPTNRIARWNGSSWNDMGSFNGSINVFAVYQNDLIAGGSFTNISGQSISRLARWDGGSWHPVLESVGGNGSIYCATTYGDALVIGGSFSAINGDYDLDHLARWDGESWSALHPSGCDQVDDDVNDVIEYLGDLYICGHFRAVNGQEMNLVARWDGSDWLPLGDGLADDWLNASANKYEIYNEGLFVGGGFITDDSLSLNCLARWDGESWSEPGHGTNNSAWALCSFDDGATRQLYVGGAFTEVGNGIPSRYIAAWRERIVTTIEPSYSVAAITLAPCTPNPFNAHTRLSFTLESAGEAVLEVLDITGRRVTVLADGHHAAGIHAVEWNGTDAHGTPLASGVYLILLRAQGETITRKAVLAK